MQQGRRPTAAVALDERRLRTLLRKPMTLEEIADKLGVHVRTVHRYLNRLDGVVRLGSTRPVYYQLSETSAKADDVKERTSVAEVRSQKKRRSAVG